MLFLVLCVCLLVTEMATIELALVMLCQLDIPDDPLLASGLQHAPALHVSLLARGFWTTPLCPSVRLLVAPAPAQRMF